MSCGAELGHVEDDASSAGRPERKKPGTTMVIGIAVVAVVLIAVVVILLKPWAKSGGASAAKEVYLIKQSVALSQNVQKSAGALRNNLEDLGNVDLSKWEGFDKLNMSNPDAAEIMTVNSDLAEKYLAAYMKNDKAGIPKDVIHYFTEKMPGLFSSYITNVLVVKQKFPASALSSMMFFSQTHIEKAPGNFDNAMVFMGYKDYTTVSLCTQYDTYVVCSCNYVIPLPLETVVGNFAEVIKDSIDIDISSGYMDKLSGSQLKDILAH